MFRNYVLLTWYEHCDSHVSHYYYFPAPFAVGVAWSHIPTHNVYLSRCDQMLVTLLESIKGKRRTTTSTHGKILSNLMQLKNWFFFGKIITSQEITETSNLRSHIYGPCNIFIITDCGIHFVCIWTRDWLLEICLIFHEDSNSLGIYTTCKMPSSWKINH